MLAPVMVNISMAGGSQEMESRVATCKRDSSRAALEGVDRAPPTRPNCPPGHHRQHNRERAARAVATDHSAHGRTIAPSYHHFLLVSFIFQEALATGQRFFMSQPRHSVPA